MTASNIKKSEKAFVRTKEYVWPQNKITIVDLLLNRGGLERVWRG